MRFAAVFALALSFSVVGGQSVFAAPTAAQALQLEPIQTDVDYFRPAGAEIDGCKIAAANAGKASGWVVEGPGGERIRLFLDTNNDKKVDLWTYYKDGIEVYRDIDTNFNGKADQYRWMGTGGTRWGLDSNEDGAVDQWKMISAEEASAEFVEAARTNDVDRFQALLPTSAELATLGLTGQRAKDIAGKVQSGADMFAKWVRTQDVIDNSTKWVHFGATRPGLVPAGTEGVSRDLVVYENAIVILDKGGESNQVEIGTLLRIGDVWKLIGGPEATAGSGDVANNPRGYFFSVAYSASNSGESMGSATGEGIQELLAALESIDTKSANASSQQEQERLAKERIDVIKQVIAKANDDDMRENWIKQLADALSGGIQTGELSEGLDQLKSLADQVDKSAPKSALAAYVRFREMSATYTQQFQKPDADFAKIQKEWLGKLEKFIKEYPASDDAAEAMMQLAIAHEFAGEEKEAIGWYAKIRAGYSGTTLAEKATGAIRRLEAIDKPFSIKGNTVGGKQLDSAAFRGKVVLVHYWATWCEPCKDDMAVIRQMQAKYGSSGFQPIGVSLDASRDQLNQFLNSTRLSWPQLYEDGGLDSRYALEMGVLTLPTMVLVSPEGKVVSRSLHITQLDSELAKLLK